MITAICLKNYASGGLYLPFLIYEELLYVFGGLTPFSLFFKSLLFYELTITDNNQNVKKKIEKIKIDFIITIKMNNIS